MNAKAKALGTAAALITAGTLAFVTQKEGVEYSVYQDIVGVDTVCAGITGKDVIPGKVYTPAECDALLKKHLVEHAAGFIACTRPDLSQGEFDAYASFTYNVGINAACKSTLAKKLIAGDRRGACDELLKWNRAGGKEVRGLTLRRQDERKLCLRDLP